jgi:hypothetical protein
MVMEKETDLEILTDLCILNSLNIINLASYAVCMYEVGWILLQFGIQ